VARFRDVGTTLRASARLIRQRPLPYVLCAVGMLLDRFLWSLFVKHFAGLDSLVAGWGVWLACSALRLAVFLAVFGCAVSQVRDVRSPVGWREALGRFGRALPYGVGVLLVLELLGGVPGFWLIRLLDWAAGVENSAHTFMIGVLFGAIPALWLVGRLGFPLVGAATGESLSLGGSWRMTRGYDLSVTATLFLWWASGYLPMDLLFHIAQRSLPLWLALRQPFYAVACVFFAVAGAVWYETLRGRDAQAPAALAGDGGQ
jgi:hypothetical protein